MFLLVGVIKGLRDFKGGLLPPDVRARPEAAAEEVRCRLIKRIVGLS